MEEGLCVMKRIDPSVLERHHPDRPDPMSAPVGYIYCFFPTFALLCFSTASPPSEHGKLGFITL